LTATLQSWHNERRPTADDLVFATRTGEPLNRANVYNRIFTPAAIRAGVSSAGLHTLRHTCATRLFRNGTNVKQVSAGSATTPPASRSTPTSTSYPTTSPNPTTRHSSRTHARTEREQTPPKPAD
jgi:integrase